MEKTVNRKAVFYFFLILCTLLVTFSSQKTVTRQAKRDAIKRRQHEKAMEEAKLEKKNRNNKAAPETLSDRIAKTVHSHTMKGRAVHVLDEGKLDL